MVGKLPNCSQARRSRTGITREIYGSDNLPPKSKPSYAPSTESQGCKRGLDVRKSVPPCGGREVFFLDILFYRTSPHPRRRRDTYKTRCAKLTIQLAQKIGAH